MNSFGRLLYNGILYACTQVAFICSIVIHSVLTAPEEKAPVQKASSDEANKLRYHVTVTQYNDTANYQAV